MIMWIIQFLNKLNEIKTFFNLIIFLEKIQHEYENINILCIVGNNWLTLYLG